MAKAKRETPTAEQRRAHVGRTVTWRSGGGPVQRWNGHHNKTGIVVAYVATGESMLTAIDRATPIRGLPDGLDISKVDRYAMLEERVGAKGQALAPKWYAPVAGIIDAAIAAEGAGK